MNTKTLMKFAVPAAMLAGSSVALAHSGATATDTTFESIQNLLTAWSEGSLGKVLAIGALIVGIGFGLVRQSVIAAVIGLSMAVVLSYGPSIITGIFTATAAGSTAAGVAQLANGLL